MSFHIFYEFCLCDFILLTKKFGQTDRLKTKLNSANVCVCDETGKKAILCLFCWCFKSPSN